MIKEFAFGSGKGFTLENDCLKITLLELGAAVRSIEYAGRNLVLGYDSEEGYLNGGSCIGAIVGRYANRIAGAQYCFNGEKVKLNANDGRNTLHGGADGLPLHKRLWHGEIINDSTVCFSILSPDGDNGFPGNCRIEAEYSIEGDKLSITLRGSTDKPTPFGPTTHTYFKLTDEDDFRSTKITIPADYVLEADKELIPTGKILKTEGKYDFNTARTSEKLSFDDCFVLRENAVFSAEAGDIGFTLRTDYPGLHFYSGEFLDGGFKAYEGFAIEPEYFPDSPNRPEFPFEMLMPGKTAEKHIEYRFYRR